MKNLLIKIWWFWFLISGRYKKGKNWPNANSWVKPTYWTSFMAMDFPTIPALQEMKDKASAWPTCAIGERYNPNYPALNYGFMSKVPHLNIRQGNYFMDMIKRVDVEQYRETYCKIQLL